MRRSRRSYLLLGLLVAGLAAVAQAADPAPPVVPRLTLEFQKTDLPTAVALLHEKTGADFVVAPGLRGTFSAKFVDEPLDKILRLLALTFNADVQMVEGVFVLKPVGTQVAAAPDGALAGAGALLPGTAPTTPLPTTAAPLTGEAGTGPNAAPTGTGNGEVRTTIPVQNRSASELANAFGAPSIGAGNPAAAAPAPNLPGGQGQAQRNPYQNLPPGARVTSNGTILLPNGTVILPSGTVVAPNGTVYTPQQYPAYYTVPYGTTIGQLQNQQQQAWQQYQQSLNPGGLSGNFAGVPFSLNGNGLTVAPPTVSLGGVGNIIIPPVNVGGSNQQQVPTVVLPPPTLYAPNQAPNVHFGQKPGNWYYGLPPNWHFTPPPGPALWSGLQQPQQ